MASYSIYLPSADSSDDQTTAFRLLRDGVSVLAIAVPPLWLAFHRLWIPLMLYLVAMLALVLVTKLTGNEFLAALSVLPGLYLFLEGQELRRGELERQGWRFGGVVEAANETEAELRFVNSGGSYISKALQKPRQAIASSIARKPMIATGIFPE